MKDNTRIPSLDGWRGISILVVIIGHEIIDGSRFGFENSSGILRYFAWHSYGVQAFFVISGYIITHLLLKEEGVSGTISFRKFYLRRFFRIIPPLFVYLFILLLLSFVFRNEIIYPFVWFKAFFFMGNFISFGTSWSTLHLWSLSVEEQYYLLWPIIYINRRSRIIIPLVFICISPILRIVEYKHPEAIGGFSFFIRADAIFIGSLFAIYFDKIKTLRIKLIEDLLLCLTLFSLIAEKTTIPYSGFLSVPFSHTLFSLSIVILIRRSLQKDSFLFTCLNIRSIVWIGQISYSLYLWQQLFYPPSILGIQVLTRFPFNFIGMFFCAWLSHLFIEKPILDWRKRLLKKRSRVIDQAG